jgi:DNA-binding MarR family transcriptional regulator
VTDRSDLALQLADAVGDAYRALQRASDRALRAYGLSRRAHAVLCTVDEAGPRGTRPKDVAAALGVSRAAATTFIQRLEGKGFLVTTSDPQDDRGVRVTLSRRGLNVLLRAGQLERRLAVRAVAGRPASAIGRAVTLLGDFRQQVERREIHILG